MRCSYHIPVQFGAPTERDLLAFFDAMDRNSGRRVWVHCAANMRVTALPAALTRRSRNAG
jgi:protein tyrosine phosphatase (PTP) superfamily phosphohydrolase (DUF442 family)